MNRSTSPSWRSLSFALVVVLASSAASAEFFVSPTGLDTDPGTLEKPFATIQRAQDAAGPGDTVHIRGGTYAMTEARIARNDGRVADVTHLDKSGTQGRPITYRAYKDEQPVFDYTPVKPADVRINAFHVTGSWIHLVGLEVVGVQVTQTGHTQSICFQNNGSHNVYERLSMHDGQAIGIYTVRGSHNLFLNCDAYRNHDFTSENGKGGNVDGFGGHPSKGSKYNVFRGCRAWFNSDDGFDCITAFESLTFENCWSFYNGMSAKKEPLADGNGFKIGGFGVSPDARVPSVVPRHTVRFCMAVGNRSSGFYANHHPGGGDWISNTAFRNGTNFNMLCRNFETDTDIDGFGHVLRNNLSFKSRRDISHIDAARCESTNNSFTLGLTITDKDFISVDESELLRPRQPGGDLPLIGFLHPSPESAIIDKGVDAGFPFKGAAPEIGAFEKY